MNKDDIPLNHFFWRLVNFKNHPLYSVISKEDMNLNFDQAFDPCLFQIFSKDIPGYDFLIISSTTGQYSPEYLFLRNNELHLWKYSRGENFSNAYVEHYSLPQMNTDEFYASSPYIVENPTYKVRRYSTDLPKDICNRIIKIFERIKEIVKSRDGVPASWTELKKGNDEFSSHSQLMVSLLGQVYEFGWNDHIFARCLDGDYYADDSLCHYLIQLDETLKDYIFSPGGANSLDCLIKINDLLIMLEKKIKNF